MLKNKAANIFLAWIILSMIYLAVVTLTGVLISNSSSKEWLESVDNVVTVQVSDPNAKSEIDDDSTRLETVVKKLRITAGINKIKILDEEQTLGLLNNWLSQDILNDINLPSLIEVKLIKTINKEQISQKIGSLIPGVSIDDHSRWKQKLMFLIDTIENLGWIIFILILIVCLASIIFAITMTIANNSDVINLIDLMGGGSSFIAEIFQKQILLVIGPAALIGSFIAIVTLFILNDYLATLLSDFLPGSISNLGEKLNFWEWSFIASTPLVFIFLSLITVRVSVLVLLGKLK
ncbi:MAG: cell division protein FtsX [Thalassobaculaceae bacterium]